MIIVSHDRYFLDQVVNTIWEMTPALEVYSGNYSAYLEQRAQRYREQLEAYQRQQEFIEKEEEYIRRNIAGQNTRQAQGRRKRLERMLEEALITPPRLQARKISLRLQPVNRSGDLVLRTYGLQVGYKDEGRPLFSAPDLILRRGECVAILGPNGAGKTTFLKTLLNQIPPFAGELQLGASLKLGYFAQAHEGLRPDYTLMEEISAAEPNLSAGEIRAYLARFLFTNDDVFKEVGMLSGGERARLALALLGLQGANLLLLDEPTNHLDLPAQEVLQSMLSEFNGTILLVTHDRYLIDALASQIWEVMPEQGQLTVFEGSYSDYKTFRQAAAGKAEENRARPAEPDPGDRRVERISKGKMKKRQQRLEALETQITKTEERCAVLARQLENPPADSAQVHRLGEEYTRLHQALEALIEEWSHLSKEVGNGE